MLRISRLTDYGVVVMTFMAGEPAVVHTSRGVATATHLPGPTVSKVLKALARGGLVASHRGVAGGYQLARPPAAITVADVIDAIEGPIAVTICGQGPGTCELESGCPTRGPWLRINRVIRQTLEAVPLSAMVNPTPATLQPLNAVPARAIADMTGGPGRSHP